MRAIRPIEVPKNQTATTPVLSALRSITGSLACVARATHPDLAYRVNAWQQQATQATIEMLRDANPVVAMALNDSERSVVK